MKIVFLCTGVEAGKDGVGDYTIKLAQACHAKGETVTVIALNDAFVQNRHDEKLPFLIVRLPKSESWDEKSNTVVELLNELKPDWLSLQFVTYSFHPKGYILSNIEFFKKITKGYRVQIMFHELWIGEELSKDFKRTIIGKFQRWSILRFIKRIAPVLINTSIPLYQTMLANYGVESQILPIFGNIPIKANPDTSWIAKEIFEKTGEQINPDNRADYVIGGFFGRIYSNWEMDRVFSELKRFHQEGKKMIFTSVGQLGSGLSVWQSYEKLYPFFKFALLGIKEEEEISAWMQYIDFGVAATPYVLLGKSGSFLAMKEHGLPVICQNPALSFRFKFVETTQYDNLTIFKDSLNWDEIPKREAFSPGLEEVTNRLLLNLHDIKKI